MPEQDKQALVNINGEGLTKPATVLIERISDAIGVLYEPRRITKKAKAEAEAAITAARSEIEVGNLRERAGKRVLAEEMENQTNIDAVVAESIEKLAEDSSPEDLDKVWLRRFFDEAKFASNTEARDRYASILAGEANSPGTFSIRSMMTLGTMSKSEAETFNALANFCDEAGQCLIFRHSDDIYLRAGLTYESLTQLDKLGLISFQPGLVRLSISSQRKDMKPQLLLVFGEESYIVTPTDERKDIPIGDVILTSEGKQLIKITNRKWSAEFIRYVKNYYTENKCQIQKKSAPIFKPLSFN